MRLEEIYQICKKNQRPLRLSLSIISNYDYGKKEMSITARESFNKAIRMVSIAIDDLGDLPSLQDDISSIKKDGKLLDKKYLPNCSVIYNKICGIVEMCEMLGYTEKEDETEFVIKMPVNIDFIELSQCISDVQIIIFQCPLFRRKDATIHLKKVDVGSTWIEFLITGVEATSLLLMVGAVIEKALTLWSYKKAIRQQDIILNISQVDEKLVEALAENYTKIFDALTEKYIEELSNDELDEEEKSRAKLCFDKLIIWFDKGLEIHDAIENGKEAKPVFPTSEKWEEIQENVLKLLTDKDDKQ